jgi:hypothetical protein
MQNNDARFQSDFREGFFCFNCFSAGGQVKTLPTREYSAHKLEKRNSVRLSLSVGFLVRVPGHMAGYCFYVLMAAIAPI